MKKKVLSCCLAVLMLLSVGCGGSSDNDSSSKIEYNKKIEIDNVTLYLPDDAEETTESDEALGGIKSAFPSYKVYKTSFGQIRISGEPGSRQMYATRNYGWDFDNEKYIEEYKSDTTLNNVKTVKISTENGIYYESTVNNKKDPKDKCPEVSLGFCSTDTKIEISIISDDSIEKAREEYTTLSEHITIDSSDQPIELKVYSAFKSAVCSTDTNNDYAYYKMTDLSAPNPDRAIERKFVENLKSNGVDKGFVYGYYVVLNGKIEKEGICYAESKESTDLKLYPTDSAELPESWKNDGKSFSQFCEVAHSAGSVAERLMKDAKQTGTTDVVLQGILKSSPDFYSTYSSSGSYSDYRMNLVFYFAYDIETGMDKEKASQFRKENKCHGQLGYCLSQRYSDGVWQESDDKDWTYMFKSDKFKQDWGDYLYVALYQSGSGYYTNIAYDYLDSSRTVEQFASMMSAGKYS